MCPTRATSGPSPETTKAPPCGAFAAMRRRGLEPPPGYPGPGPQPGNPSVISVRSRQIVRIVPKRGRYGRIGRSGCCHGCCHGRRLPMRDNAALAAFAGCGAGVGLEPRHADHDSAGFGSTAPFARAGGRGGGQFRRYSPLSTLAPPAPSCARLPRASGSEAAQRRRASASPARRPLTSLRRARTIAAMSRSLRGAERASWRRCSASATCRAARLPSAVSESSTARRSLERSLPLDQPGRDHAGDQPARAAGLADEAARRPRAGSAAVTRRRNTAITSACAGVRPDRPQQRGERPSRPRAARRARDSAAPRSGSMARGYMTRH